MPATILIGAQWGDEGKGKVIDYFSKDADLVVRFQGGNNAGHTVVVGDKTFKLHFLPSGVISGKECCMGNGMVIEPKALLDEIKEVESQGLKVDKLTLSDRSHVITGKHMAEDAKDTKIGTTKRGIGPCYTDKAARTGPRVCDVLNKYSELNKYIGDVSLKVNQAIDAGKNVFFEGAQGTLLDIDFGTYPYVTSSNTIAGGACTGAGVGPTKINRVIGVVKAYTTRVGEGPFPTELSDETGESLRENGHEFGTTTGRPRRCGWLDLVLVNYAVRVNGLSEIALTKIDVLSGIKTLKICTKYELDGEIVENPPADLSLLEKCKPVYEELPGWEKLATEEWRSVLVSGYKNLPEQVRGYMEFIETFTKTPIKLISYGPARSDTFIKG